MNPQWKTALAALLFVAAAGLIGYRAMQNLNVPGQPVAAGHGLIDFRDAVYYPSKAVIDGINPYDADTYRPHYPVTHSFPPYSPLSLLVHLPFAWLDFDKAQAVYFVFSILLVLALSALSLRLCGLPGAAAAAFLLATFMVLGRPGHWGLVLGQVVPQLAIATFVALGFARSRPLLSGLGLALATIKPTYGVPLAILMLVRGDKRAVAAGILVAAVLTGAVTARLAVIDGPASLMESFEQSVTTRESTPEKTPAGSLLRVDVVSLTARLTGSSPGVAGRLALFGVVIGAAAVPLRRLVGVGSPAASLLSSSIVCVTMLLCAYHQQYDCLLLVLPLVAVTARPDAGGLPLPPVQRWTAALLLALPFLNYVASYTGAGALGLGRDGIGIASTINGVALIAALALLISAAYAPQSRDAGD